MQGLIVFSETGMHHLNRYRRNVFLPGTLFERFENPARIGRPSARRVCPSEVCLEPAVFLSKADGGLELVDALILLTRGEESQAELRMRARDRGIHLQCLAHLGDRLVVVLLPAKPDRGGYVPRELRVAKSHLHVRRGEVGLPFDGFRQIRNRLSKSLRVFFPGGSHSLEEKFIRDRIDLRVSVKPRSGLRRELRSKRFRNGRRELALKSDDVAFVALVAPRPDMMIGRGVDQLRGDAHTSACAQYSSFDYAIHGEVTGD